MRYTISTLALAISTPAVAQDVALPDLVEWGGSAAAIEAALEGKCANGLTVRDIDTPFLPDTEQQVQIDCDGLEHFGAPRWAEFVIGDDRLQMLWIMVDSEEEDSAIEAMRAAYGEPTAESEMFVAFADANTAWRTEPAEFLYYSPELAEAMSAWFASTGG
ncbi:hypothetical protein OZN62_08190 [Aurantiacibacter sp. MUD11]|uniref:hypothetical protein n=1 Tax=Aurantiacibacter sp. MUD11 TaxID=3003265 RepID=UPI0022AA84AD|nr:hypothetical protein [Aurantiacibacter sp. MUD11]WAT16919.1 hypothetical protein OZN62_08190 [Aurantiacibacter sp. MUD11]